MSRYKEFIRVAEPFVSERKLRKSERESKESGQIEQVND
jgi:hypothetical protein